MKCPTPSLLRSLIPSLIILILTLSCRDEGVDGPVDMIFTDIATFSGNVNGHAILELREGEDSPSVKLTAQGALSGENLDKGTRLLIRYTNASNQPYRSGDITLLSASVINQSAVMTEWDEEYDLWNRDGVYLYSIWRTGSYINLHVRLTYSREPRLFTLAADPATLDTEWPELYLVHIMSDPSEYHDRAYFASFDIASIWKKPEVKGIKVNVANTNLDKHIFTFTKQN